MNDNWNLLWKSHKAYDVHPQLIELISKYTKGKKVLEIGFGTGGDLLQLKKKGYDCYGIETSPIAAKRGKQILGKEKIFLGDGKKMDFCDNFFDTIYHQGLLEHFKDPKPFLFEQRRILSSNGIIIIDVPHKWNLYTLYRKFLQLRGKWYGGWERSFSKSELEILLNSSGFKTLSVSYRGIFPHQWGKILFPENIKEKSWAINLLKMPVIKQIRGLLRYLYNNNQFFQALNSYNIIIVAQKRPLKIGIDARYAEQKGGGISNYISQLTEYIVKKGDIPILISTKEIKAINESAQNVVLKVKGNWIIWEQIQLVRTLNQLNIDLFHAAGNYGIPFFYSKPSILTIHDVIPVLDEGYFNASIFPYLSRILYNIRIQSSIRLSKTIICTTEENKKEIEKYFPDSKNKIKIIPMGVSNIFFSDSTLEDKSLLDKLSVRKPYILNNGGIDERKNLPNLINAFSRILKTYKLNNYLLVITGENSRLTKNLKLLSEAEKIKNKIKFLGFVNKNEIAALVKNADIIAYTTRAEGFGLPVIESMAAGVPIVTSKLPVFKKLGGDVPIYIDQNNPKEIAKGLIRARKVSLNRIKRGVNMAKEFSWEKAMEETYKSYLN